MSSLGKATIRKALLTLLVIASVGLARPALAQGVSDCDALTLYGNAFNQGVCTSLSPPDQTHLVCALFRDENTDVHLTFNQTTALHITVGVEAPACRKKSDLAGEFPMKLAIGAGQSATLCAVNIADFVTKLNGVAAAQPDGAASSVAFCKRPFLDAMGNHTLDPSTAQGYIDKCNQNCKSQ